MAIPLVAGLPPYLTLGDSYTVRLTAYDPVTGVEDTGVVISSASISVDTGSGVSIPLPPPSPVTGAYTTV